LLNSPRYELTITFNSSDRWTPSFSVPRWYDAVASLCHLFSRGNDHVVETSRAHHYRAPCCHRRIAALVLTSVGWDDRCAPLRYKREALPRCCHYQVSPAFELDSAATLCFSLRLVFGQPPLAHLCRCSAHSLSKLSLHLRRQPPEEARKKTERRTPTGIADHGSVLGDVRVPPLDACRDVSPHHRWDLSSLSFSCAHSSPASHERR
jgi:hypothetical protein